MSDNANEILARIRSRTVASNAAQAVSNLATALGRAHAASSIRPLHVANEPPQDFFTRWSTTQLHLPLPYDFTNWPPELLKQSVEPSVLYVVPISLNVSTIRFHLRAWAAGAGPEVWHDVDRPDTYLSGGRLLFTSAGARRSFLRWWDSYQKRFFRNADAATHFLPLMGLGSINGVFVPQPLKFDSIISFFYTRREPPSTELALLALAECVDRWGWIAWNCRFPVVRTMGGWIFNSRADAAKYILFHEGNDGLVAKDI